MLRLLRIPILVVLALLILSLAMAVGSGVTGPMEKVVLVAAIVGLYGLALPVWRIGEPPRRS